MSCGLRIEKPTFVIYPTTLRKKIHHNRWFLQVFIAAKLDEKALRSNIPRRKPLLSILFKLQVITTKGRMCHKDGFSYKMLARIATNVAKR